MEVNKKIKTCLLNIIDKKLRSAVNTELLDGHGRLLYAIVFSAFDDMMNNTLRPSEKLQAYNYLFDSWHAEAIGIDQDYLTGIAKKTALALGTKNEALFENHISLPIEHF